jgi:hypothetical protein
MGYSKMIDLIDFWILMGIGVICAALAQPYQYTLMKKQIQIAKLLYPEKKILRTPVMFLLAILQSSILFGVAAFVGMSIATKVDLHWLILSHWRNGTILPFSFMEFFIVSLSASFCLVITTLLLERCFFKDLMPATNVSENPTRFKAFLASFYGGVFEEIVARFGLMSLIVFVGVAIGLRETAYWFGIMLSALGFAALHLPAAFQFYSKRKVVIVRTILLNSLGGLVFGWLYWEYGLESAILAHLVADMIMHVFLAPILNKNISQSGTEKPPF